MRGDELYGSDPEAAAQAVFQALRARGQTVAVAESLTGGLLAATLVDIPGVSAVFRGGFVVYATELKHTLAGVPEKLLEEVGPVDDNVALALADGARTRCGADWGVATTGVAGPEPQDGKPAGLVYVAACSDERRSVTRLELAGRTRAEVRRASVAAALWQLVEELGEPAGHGHGPGMDR
jgi:nicotinamide-nucleotide amidase